MEPKPALVRAQRAVELHAHAAIDLYPAAVVLPGDTEQHLTIRLADPFDDALFEVFRMAGQQRFERADHLGDSLMELRLTGIARNDVLEDGTDTTVNHSELPTIGHGTPRHHWRTALCTTAVVPATGGTSPPSR